jgi:hypothetical protein
MLRFGHSFSSEAMRELPQQQDKQLKNEES